MKALLFTPFLFLTVCAFDPSARSTMLDTIKFEASYESEDGSKNANVSIQPFE